MSSTVVIPVGRHYLVTANVKTDPNIPGIKVLPAEHSVPGAVVPIEGQMFNAKGTNDTFHYWYNKDIYELEIKRGKEEDTLHVKLIA